VLAPPLELGRQCRARRDVELPEHREHQGGTVFNDVDSERSLHVEQVIARLTTERGLESRRLGMWTYRTSETVSSPNRGPIQRLR
jgi:hypothetical protein